MKPANDWRGVGGAQFHIRRWTLVMVSAQSRAEEAEGTFAELCRLYWQTLYSFARPRWYLPHDARDLTQGFSLHLREHRGLAQVDRLKGEFRSFLLASFKNCLSNGSCGARTFERVWSYECIFLHWESAETSHRREPADHLTAEKIFDAGWATTLLNEAMTLFRHALIASEGCLGP